jgi:DNA polymerase I-like protein with 3'-5' exonuclease and polymerase domains
MIRTCYDARACRDALAGTDRAVLDLETTGLRRWDRIVSAGVLVGDCAYILYVRSRHPSVRNLPLSAFRAALEPLGRRDLTLVFHNAVFDLGFLKREGIRVDAVIHDALKALLLLDQDRGPLPREQEEGQARPARQQARIDLRAPAGAPVTLDYKLKHVARQLLGLRLREFPGSIETAPRHVHDRYLLSDLVGTRRLSDFLWASLTPGQEEYYRQLVAPLTPLLVEMGHVGVRADPEFIGSELIRLEELAERLSAEHRRRHGRPLGMDARQLQGWLFARHALGLTVLKWNRRAGSWMPSLDAEALNRLLDYARLTGRQAAQDSLELIHDDRQVASLLARLRSLLPHVDRTGRIHTVLNDIQATGRVSSSYPNLQQLAKEFGPKARKKFISAVARDVTVLSRNALVASPGHTLVSFDTKQADVRILADRVGSFPFTHDEYREMLQGQRLALLGRDIQPYGRHLERCRNPNFVATPTPPVLLFDPADRSGLVEDFTTPGDFYAKAVTRVLGRPPRDDAERDYYKPVVLGIINGQGPVSLAKALKCEVTAARAYLEAFEAAYPKEAAYKRLMYLGIAYTGQSVTFMGRVRTATAHRWMVTEPRVLLLVSYKRSDAYWVEVVPLQPHLRVLTTYVFRAWNARVRPPRLLYDHRRGRLGARSYRLFADRDLLFRLPVRNWSWRSIRRVRGRGEEAEYQGFDATARSLFNAICQGGTADLVKLMMLRSVPVCQDHGARLLLQIHDELVFEVPTGIVGAFIPSMQDVLQLPPCPGFRVPIEVGVKCGDRFGELRKP